MTDAADLSGKILRHAKARGGITLADVMRKFSIDMREASRLLRIEVAAGTLARTGGGPGEAFRWRVVKQAAPPKPLPAPTMEERAEAARSARAMRAALWDRAAMGDERTAHLDFSRPRRAEWLTTWGNLPGFKRVNGRYLHALLPGWQYTQPEVAAEMIPDLEALAERGVRPTEATSGVGA